MSGPGDGFIEAPHFPDTLSSPDRFGFEIVAQQKQVKSISYPVLCQYLQVTQATNQIVMNCADIDIITASFAPQGGEGEGRTLSAFSPLFCF